MMFSPQFIFDTGIIKNDAHSWKGICINYLVQCFLTFLITSFINITCKALGSILSTAKEKKFMHLLTIITQLSENLPKYFIIIFVF
jgi:hypothetical protein